jgi:hypothetical protein
VATKENKATEDVKLRAAMYNATLMRNNTGVAYTKDGRPVFFGLGNEGKKSNDSIRTSDLVGWTTITVTPEMVGKQVAVFTAPEVKKLGFIKKLSYNPNTREHGQNIFREQVINAGGIADFVTCADDVDSMYNEFNERMMK